jgi:CRISPR-associated protein Cmr5
MPSEQSEMPAADVAANNSNVPVARLRSRHALERIDQLKGKTPGHYVSYVKALPATIIKNGLAQALAMELAAQKDPGHRRLYQDCAQWLCSGWPASPIRRTAAAPANDGDFIRAIVNSDEDALVRLQIETLEYLFWLKKFAIAFLDKKDGTPVQTATQEVVP